MPGHTPRRRYPPELRERAVQMVFDRVEQSGDLSAVVALVARELAVGPQSLRHWVRRAQVSQQSRVRRIFSAAARLVFPARHIEGLRRLTKAFLLAGGLAIVAGIALLAIAPDGFGYRPTWEVGVCEVDALAGIAARMRSRAGCQP